MAEFEPILYETEEVGKRVKASKVKHTWMLEVSGSQYIVEYFDSRASSKARLTLNEQEIFRGKKQGSEFTIPFGLGRKAALLVSKGPVVDLLISNQYFKHVWARIQQEPSIPVEEFEPDFPDSPPQKPARTMATEPPRADLKARRPAEAASRAVEQKPPALYEAARPEPPSKQPSQEQKLFAEMTFEPGKTEDSEAVRHKASDLLEEIFNPQPANTVKQPETVKFEEAKSAPNPPVQPLPSQPFVSPPMMPFMNPYPTGQMYMTPQGMMFAGPMMGVNPAMYMSQPVYMAPSALAMPIPGVVPAVRRDLDLSTAPNMTPSQYHNQGDLPDFTPHAGLIGSNPIVVKNSRLNQDPVVLERGNPFTSNHQVQDKSFSTDQQLHSVVDLSNLGKNMHSPPLAQRYQDQVRGVQVPGSDPVVPMKDLQRRG